MFLLPGGRPLGRDDIPGMFGVETNPLDALIEFGVLVAVIIDVLIL